MKVIIFIIAIAAAIHLIKPSRNLPKMDDNCVKQYVEATTGRIVFEKIPCPGEVK